MAANEPGWLEWIFSYLTQKYPFDFIMFTWCFYRNIILNAILLNLEAAFLLTLNHVAFPMMMCFWVRNQHGWLLWALQVWWCVLHILICTNVMHESVVHKNVVCKNVVCKNVACKNVVCKNVARYNFYILKSTNFTWSVSSNSPCGMTFHTTYDPRYMVVVYNQLCSMRYFR